jgi:hypothetical protein
MSPLHFDNREGKGGGARLLGVVGGAGENKTPSMSSGTFRKEQNGLANWPAQAICFGT